MSPLKSIEKKQAFNQLRLASLLLQDAVRPGYSQPSNRRLRFRHLGVDFRNVTASDVPTSTTNFASSAVCCAMSRRQLTAFFLQGESGNPAGGTDNHSGSEGALDLATLISES